MSYELVACVVGLTNGYKEVFGTRPGIGKSCLCFRLAYPEYDSYVDNHPSLFALHEFESRVVNSNHFIYWGSPVKFFPVRGGDCKVKFHLIEQTVFYQDVTSLPFNHSVTKPDNVDSYVKRIVGPIESTGKISYHSRDSIVTGMPAGHAVANYPSGITRLPRGFIVVFDVSVTGKALAAQCKRVDPILSYLDKHKKKFILAVTKRDKYSMPSLEKAYELRKKYRTHLVECSALDDLNVEEVLRVLALIVISKKISGLTDQVTRYHDAAQHVLFRRTSAKAAFKSYVRKKVTNYDERLVSVQLSEEFKECARWIGSYKTGCMFALHVLELYNSKVEERYAGVADDPDMHTEYLEDFVDQRKDIEAFKAEMRRWIVSYVSEFARAPRSRKRSQPNQTHYSEGAGSNSTEPSDSNHPVETTTRSEQDSIQTAISNTVGAPPPPATPTKPGQVPEGYHIFESLSKVSKNGSMKQAAEEAGTVEQSNKEEVAGAGRVKGATEAAENSCKEGNVDGQEEGNDDDGEGDTASIYSDNSMESVSDHDYLNFDPKSGGVWPEESSTPLPASNPTAAAAAAASDLQSGDISEGLPSTAKDEDDDSDDEYDYENLKDFIGDADYMNAAEAIQKATHEVPQSKPDPPLVEPIEPYPGSNSQLAASERCEDAGGVGNQTDSSMTTTAMKEPRAAAPPKVSPKPGTKKTNPPPPLVLPPPSPELQCTPRSSESSPSISSSDTSSLRPSTEDAASTSSQPSPKLKKPKPATPIRRSSLNNKKIVSPLMQPSHSNTQNSSSSPVHPHKPQNPVGRSSSIRQRAKLLEMSMTSSSSSEVSTEDPVVLEKSKTGKSTINAPNHEDSAMSMHETGSFAASRVDLPPVPELTNSHVADDSQVHTPLVTNDTPATGTTQEGANSSPNMEVRDVGVSSSSSHLSLQAQRLAGLRSPGHLPAIPKAVTTPAITAADATVTTVSSHVLGSSVANGTTDLPTPSSSTSLDPQATSALQKRPRLTQIRKKLAQKKEVSEVSNGQITSDHNEIGSTSSLRSESSSTTPTRRPNLATIRKRLKESESEIPEDVPQLESELSNVSPFSSINLPPIRAHPPPPPVKRGSAPAASIAQSLSSERLKEWNARKLKKSESEENGLPNEVPPPIPERSKAIFQIVSSPPHDPVARHKEYFNVLMKTKKDSSTATAVTPAERSNITSPSKESTVPVTRKKRGAANVGPEGSTTDKVANQHSQQSSKMKSKKEGKDQTQKEQQTSPIKKAFAYLTVKNKDLANSRKKDEVVPQTRAKFINMATRPLPMLPGQSYDPNDEPDHTERDYEEFGSNSGVVGDEAEYLNYPNLPAAVAHVHGNREGRSQSQEPQLPTPTTRSAPNTPMLQGRSQTLGRPGTKRGVGVAHQLSHDDDGYINSDLLPNPLVPDLPYRAPIPIPTIPATEHASEGQRSHEETNSDYDYPDLRLTGAFNSPYAKQQAITKLERSKISAYDFQQPRKTQKMRTLGASSDTDKGALGEEGDDQGLRDRAWSTASSTYVPMANLYPSDDEDDYVPPNEVEIDEFTQRFKFRSALDHSGGDLPKVDEQEGMVETSEGDDQCETVYMNLPFPEKVSAVVPPPVMSPKPSMVKSSVDDSHISSKTKYPVVKPKPTKKRSATIAADISAEVKEVSPHEGWNKTGIIRESEGEIPPRNILRQTVV